MATALTEQTVKITPCPIVFHLPAVLQKPPVNIVTNASNSDLVSLSLKNKSPDTIVMAGRNRQRKDENEGSKRLSPCHPKMTATAVVTPSRNH